MKIWYFLICGLLIGYFSGSPLYASFLANDFDYCASTTDVTLTDSDLTYEGTTYDGSGLSYRLTCTTTTGTEETHTYYFDLYETPVFSGNTITLGVGVYTVDTDAYTFKSNFSLRFAIGNTSFVVDETWVMTYITTNSDTITSTTDLTTTFALSNTDSETFFAISGSYDASYTIAINGSNYTGSFSGAIDGNDIDFMPPYLPLNQNGTIVGILEIINTNGIKTFSPVIYDLDGNTTRL